MAETSQEGMDARGRETVEGVLGIAAYVAYMEWCSIKGDGSSAHLKGLAHRSAGPLWALLKRSVAELGDRAHFSKGLRALTGEEISNTIDEVLQSISNSKHDMACDIDFPYVISLLGNIVLNALRPFVFGSFESVRKKGLYGGFYGTFRGATGSRPPFINLFDYVGDEAISDEGVYLVDLEQSKALPLSPLVVRMAGHHGRYPQEADLWFFDKVVGETVFFKAIQMRPPLKISPQDELSALNAVILQMKAMDQSMQMLERIILKQVSHTLEED